MSVLNEAEAAFVMEMLSHFLRRFAGMVREGGVGVITPYRKQCVHLRRMVRSSLPRELGGCVEVNTVDGFQGREKDVILVSCVRAARAGEGGDSDGNGGGGSRRRGGGIGFLADERRMNVALTRGRYAVWVIGHAATLAGRPGAWRELVAHARATGTFVSSRGVGFEAMLAGGGGGGGGGGRWGVDHPSSGYPPRDRHRDRGQPSSRHRHRRSRDRSSSRQHHRHDRDRSRRGDDGSRERSRGESRRHHSKPASRSRSRERPRGRKQ